MSVSNDLQSAAAHHLPSGVPSLLQKQSAIQDVCHQFYSWNISTLFHERWSLTNSRLRRLTLEGFSAALASTSRSVQTAHWHQRSREVCISSNRLKRNFQTTLLN